MNTTTPELIGSAEACKMLGITRATLSRRVASGRMTAVMQMPGPNGAFVFRRDHIEALANKRGAA